MDAVDSSSLSPQFHPSSSPSPIPLPLPQIPKFGFTQLTFRHYSTNNNDNNNNGQTPTSDFWKITPENDNFGSVFDTHDGDLTGIADVGSEEREKKSGNGAADDWLNTTAFKPWRMGKEEKVEHVFDFEDVERVAEGGGSVGEIGFEKEKEKTEDDLQLQKEEETLLAVLKGPNRSFGDLVAASGITDAMLDSLIALKDFKNIDGLPPLTEIEDKRYENSFKKSSRYEMELQKQEEAAKSRVRQVDEKGRAYGTGRRKCSIARVWIQPGEGNLCVNDKDFDVYFPMLDHRAALLRPFAETKTLGLWDVKCTVKGGGVSAGFLTRDPRVVERKKPGKAKARKSFQWVKR